MSKPKQTMSFRDAMALVDDDLPDGAFFAMAHEIAGLEYGDGFDELICEDERATAAQKIQCPSCKRLCQGLQGFNAHWEAKHPTDQKPRYTVNAEGVLAFKSELGLTKVQCPSCTRYLNGLGGFHMHWKTVHEGRPPFVFIPGRTNNKSERNRQRKSWQKRRKAAAQPEVPNAK